MKAGHALFTLLVALSGCVHRLAPPRIVERPIASGSLRAAPAEEGTARVLIDVSDGPARVEELIDDGHVVRPASAQSWVLDSPPIVDYAVTRARFVCNTPCVANLRRGPQRLSVLLLDHEAMAERFGVTSLRPAANAAELPDSSNTISPWLDARPQALRVTLGHRHDNFGWHALGVSMLVVGLLGSTAGAIFLPSVLASPTPENVYTSIMLNSIFGSMVIGGSIVLGALPSTYQPAAYRVSSMAEPTR
ncbi:MAG: hypothetical protein Q8Q09_23935 [Deltaproteobacteria bacterium]|nr:hypothetical protein [Deltaproteobacteria bacterium]